jgi:phosphatidylglycerophosphatase C
VIVVSASPLAIVEAGAALVGVSADRVIAMRPNTRSGHVAPGLDGPVVYGEGKLTALRSMRPESPILGAFGDSTYDAALLRAARVPVAVYPSKGLLDLAPTIPGVVVIGSA